MLYMYIYIRWSTKSRTLFSGLERERQREIEREREDSLKKEKIESYLYNLIN